MDNRLIYRVSIHIVDYIEIVYIFVGQEIVEIYGRRSLWRRMVLRSELELEREVLSEPTVAFYIEIFVNIELVNYNRVNINNINGY